MVSIRLLFDSTLHLGSKSKSSCVGIHGAGSVISVVFWRLRLDFSSRQLSLYLLIINSQSSVVVVVEAYLARRSELSDYVDDGRDVVGVFMVDTGCTALDRRFDGSER